MDAHIVRRKVLRLSALLDDHARLSGGSDVDVRGLCADSRNVRAGDMFAALSGTQADGHIFIPEALAKGAVAILGGKAVEAYSHAVPVVVYPNPRQGLARIAARLYGGQPSFIGAVTGTNGKTSIVSYTRQLWELQGSKAASLGTLGIETGGTCKGGSLTTPDPVAMHKMCAELDRSGVRKLALEASSHGLAQYRLDGLHIKAAAFTNISRDHFDYHGSYESYFAAKSRLFNELLEVDGAAILNADVPEYTKLAAIAHDRGCDVIDYGLTAERCRIVSCQPGPLGQTLTIDVQGKQHQFDTALVGSFQAHNLLAALALAVCGGADLDQSIECLSKVRGAPGRMELAARHPNGAPAFVDYAHTPDALEKAIDGLRPHVRGQLHVVFGCGGDRDPGKRSLMGEIAGRLADRIYVTDDNPRNEPAASIRSAIMAAAPMDRTKEIGDRGEAIELAFNALQADDLLLVAGKGHEQGQIVGGQNLPFDDAQKLRQIQADSECSG